MHAIKQAGRQAGEQAGKQASKQESKQARRRLSPLSLSVGFDETGVVVDGEETVLSNLAKAFLFTCSFCVESTNNINIKIYK